jgi:O-antigen/teichoic acid export membrane protein
MKSCVSMVETQLVIEKSAEAVSDTNRVRLRERFIRGVSWNLIGTLLGQGSVFASNIIIANHLGPQSFGEFSLLQNTALTFSAIAQVATGVTATRYIAEYRNTDPDRAGRIIGFCSLLTLATGLIVGLLLFILSGWLSATTLNAPHLSDALKIMALYLVFSAMSGYQTGALAGLEGYRHIARLGVLHGGIHVVCCAAGVWLFGLPGALWALVASLAARWWLYYAAIQSEAQSYGIRPAYVIQERERSILLRFSVPAALAGLTSMPALWLANTFLVQQPDGFKQLGLYSAAFSLKAAVMLLPNTVNNVGGSIIHNQLGLTDQSLYKNAFWSNAIATTLAALVGALFVIVAGEPLLGLFGEQFRAAYVPLIFLMIATVPEAFASALYQIIQSRERMWWSLIAVNLPRDGIIIIAAYFLVETRGASGIAIAYLLGWSVTVLVIATKASRIGIKTANTLDSV